MSADTSTVLLAADASSVVGVQLAGSGEIGDVTGTGKSISASGLLKLNVFAANAVLNPGEQVVTYASIGDRPEVPGVPVGTIASVAGSAGSLTQTALVRPFVNFTALGVVGVVVQVPPRNPARLDPAAAGADRHRDDHATPVPSAAGLAVPDLDGHAPEADVRGLISLVIVAVTVVFQLTVVDRIAFPGGSGPDLVLVVVAALALASGPLAGTVIGFLGGLALDVAPPGSQFTGQDALVFCLIGYACGLLADDTSTETGTDPGHTALFEIVVTAVGAVCGEALVALLGVMLSDPRVSWPAITRVLPVAVVYDVLLCPFVLYAAAAAWRLAGARGTGASTARTPARGAPSPGAGRAPHLKLGSGRSMTGGRGLRASRGRLGAALGGTRAAAPALRTSGFTRSHLGRSWLGGSVFSHAPALGLPGRSPALGRSSPLARSPLSRSSPLARSPLRHRSLFSRKVPFSNRGKLGIRGYLSHRGYLGHRGQLKSPGRGWLRGSARSRSRPSGRHPLGRSGPLGPARLRMPRSKARRNWRARWRTGGYR